MSCGIVWLNIFLTIKDGATTPAHCYWVSKTILIISTQWTVMVGATFPGKGPQVVKRKYVQ